MQQVGVSVLLITSTNLPNSSMSYGYVQVYFFSHVVARVIEHKPCVIIELDGDL